MVATSHGACLSDSQRRWCATHLTGVWHHAGAVDGYSILGMTELELHQEQANWIRDFIAANS